MTIAVRNMERTSLGSSTGEVWVEEKGLPHVGHSQDVTDLGDRILVATELGPISHRVEARAMDLAAEGGASLVVAAVVRPGVDRGRLDEVARQARERGIRTETRIASGDAVEALLHVASSVGATGIVVGDDQWQGQIPHPCICAPLIRQASCPVLVLHRSADQGCELHA